MTAANAGSYRRVSWDLRVGRNVRQANVELRSLVHPGRRAAMDRAAGMTAQAVKAMTAPVPVLAAVGVVPLAPLLALVAVVAVRPAL